MGYRSTVAIALTTEANEQFTATRNQLIESYPECFLVEPYISDVDSLVYLLEDSKWYDDLPLRKTIEDFFEELDEEEDYFYIIVGEEPNDVTEVGSSELKDYWELYTSWGLDTTPLQSVPVPEKVQQNLASLDFNLVSPSYLIYKVELMLCWDDNTWSEGEYVFVSSLVNANKVERLAVDTYMASKERHSHHLVHVTVYNWNSSDVYQNIDGELIKQT